MDKIRERISFISGFLLVLGAGFVSLANSYAPSFTDHRVRDDVFSIGYALAVLLLLVSILFTAYCLMGGFRYQGTQPTTEFYDVANAWEKYNSLPSVTVKSDAVAEMKDELSEVYANAAAHNSNLNIRRTDLLIWAMRLGFFSALIAVVPTACVALSKHDAQPPSQVRVVDSVNVKIK